ncbi:MAG TPA: stress protein [Lachnospiraceae bacterium]|nr:stress protein [Lachnospiraceae bacterium]
MGISLQKGQKVSLTKEKAGLDRIVIGLGWDEVERKRGFFAPKPTAIDCDASALVLQDGKLKGKEDIVYFGNLKHHTGAIMHMGDNLTGAGAGDDEQIIVELSKIPEKYDKIILVVNIYDAYKRKQHFGMIKNAFIRLVDERDGKEVCRYNLSESYDNMTAMVFGEVYHHNGEWKFNAVGQGTQDEGLGQLAQRYT